MRITSQIFNGILSGNRWLASLFGLTMIVALSQFLTAQSYQNVFAGVVQLGGPIYLPLVWLTLMLMPFLALGSRIRQIVKVQYVHHRTIPLMQYLWGINGAVSVLASAFWLVPVVIMRPANLWVYIGVAWGYLSLLMMIYSLLTLYMKPVLVVMGLVVLFVAGCVNNQFPIISALMLSRFVVSSQILGDYVGLMIVIIVLMHNVAKIDFLPD